MFYGFVITEAGNNLLAKMVAGEKLTITKVVMDKGTATDAEAARKLTAPIDPGPKGTSTVPTVEGNAVNLVVEYPTWTAACRPGSGSAVLPSTARRTRRRKL